MGSPGFLVQETNPIGFRFTHAPERSSFWLLCYAWRWGTSSSLLALKIIIVSSAGAWAFLAHSAPASDVQAPVQDPEPGCRAQVGQEQRQPDVLWSGIS